ncbi:hypothetical protein ACHAWF_001651 [Thalassiosira exigua]
MTLLPSLPGRALGVAAAISFVSTSSIDGFAPPHRSSRTTTTACTLGSGESTTQLFAGSGIENITSVSIDADIGRGINATSLQAQDEGASAPSASAAAPPPANENAKECPRGPPLVVEDPDLLLYDAFLLTNLALSISFCVVHRMDALFVPASLHEGALLSTCWIVAGLWNGSFLSSAVDGHYDPRGAEYGEKGGPKAAGLLAVSTFVSTSSLRIVAALLSAAAERRPVGIAGSGEELIPSEIIFGLVLMSAWRALHSANTSRI